MRRARPLVLAGLVAVGLTGTGCADDGTAATPRVGVDGRVTVFAAASLTEVFTELGDAFEAANPAADVRFNFAASSELVAQIREGAPADVFASADTDTMAELTAAGATATEPVVFTTNRAEIVVGAGNPEGVTGVADLADGDLIVISCAPAVPCGRYAQRVLDRAGVSVTFKSLEENVRAVVSKVTLGEADAGIVYVTDVMSVGDAADGVEIPADLNVTAEYPIVVTSEAADPVAAQAFVDFVVADEGQAILQSYGFVAP